MANIDQLYSLIQSLDKTEKRYYTLQSSVHKGEKKYLQLFKILEEHKHLETLQSKLLTQYSKIDLDVSLKHIYKTLMRSLRNYESEKTIESKLLNSIQDIKILFDKGI